MISTFVLLSLVTVSSAFASEKVFVSSVDGNDSNDGITRPVATLAKGLEILRNRELKHLDIRVTLIRAGKIWMEST